MKTRWIKGKPAPAPRQSQRDRWAKRRCVERYRAWRDLVRLQFGPVPRDMAAVRVVLYLPIPKSRRRTVTVGDPHRVRPDSDNYAKGVIDALYPHRGPEDDGQLAHEEATKIYTDGEVGVSVTLLTWPEYTRIHNLVEAELAAMRGEGL